MDAWMDGWMDGWKGYSRVAVLVVELDVVMVIAAVASLVSVVSIVSVVTRCIFLSQFFLSSCFLIFFRFPLDF